MNNDACHNSYSMMHIVETPGPQSVTDVFLCKPVDISSVKVTFLDKPICHIGTPSKLFLSTLARRLSLGEAN